MSHAIKANADFAHPFRATAGLDHKAWAKKIMYRHACGDTTLEALFVKMAREALGIEAPAT